MQGLIILLILILEFEIIAEKDEKGEKEKDPDEIITSSTSQSISTGESFSKCYDEIGCVETDETWFHSKFRPVNLKPLDRDVIKTEFILIRQNRSGQLHPNIFYQVITPNEKSLQDSGFKQSKFLFMLIHDFTANGHTGWIKDHHELTLGQVHLIGHGIGAHIAGYVGYAIKTHKITGLDPSGPRFDGMPIHVRLDASDANYVEVLHTDVMEYNSQGAKSLFGHTDFFINNGEIQPGCPPKQTAWDLLSVTRATLNSGEILPGCSHKRAYKYYIESLEVEECTFLGIKCPSYLEFRQGKCTTCGENCRTFGLVTYSEHNNGSYFLQTDKKRPYCMYQYRVTVQIKPGDRSSYFGFFEFILRDKNLYTTMSSMLEPRDFKPGGDNSFVFYAGVPEMHKIIDAKVGWVEKRKLLCFINCKQAIDVEKVTIQSINSNTKYSQEVSLCPKNGMSEIHNGDYVEFILCKR